MKSTSSRIRAWLLLPAFIISCNEKPSTEAIEMNIENDEIRISSQPEPRSAPCANTCVELKSKLTNNSGSTFLLYNFSGNIQFGNEDARQNCDSVWSPTSTRLNLFNDAMDYIPINEPLVNGGTRDEQNRKKWALFFRKGMIIIGPGEQLEFSEVIDFRGYRLRSPGTYFVNLLYIQLPREFIEQQLSEEEIDKDLANTKASLYRGCVFSNTIKLVVE